MLPPGAIFELKIHRNAYAAGASLRTPLGKRHPTSSFLQFNDCSAVYSCCDVYTVAGLSSDIKRWQICCQLLTFSGTVILVYDILMASRRERNKCYSIMHNVYFLQICNKKQFCFEICFIWKLLL